MDELLALRVAGLPLAVIGDDVIVGYRPNELSRALGLGIRFQGPGLEETIRLLGRVPRAVERAVGDMPDDKLQWQAPGRSRSMQEFTHHILGTVRNTIRRLEDDDVPPIEDAYAAMAAQSKSYSSFKQIAAFGSEVIDEYTAWEGRQDPRELGRRWFKGQDHRTARERLDWATGHTVHHLRQLYWVLGHGGIQPTDPMPDAEFPQEYFLSIVSGSGGLF